MGRPGCCLPAFLLGLTLCFPAAFADTAPSPVPQVQAAPAGAPPVIDGKLDDACWAQATRLEGFLALGIERPLPEETIGLVCADEKAIYVAAICKDRTPDDIKAVETRRDGEIWRDDYVELGLDAEHGHRNSYYFDVSARGTQSDSIPGGSASKREWRGDWQAAALRTLDGYQVEIAVPFAILRHPPHQTTFGLTLGRWFAAEQVYVAYPTSLGLHWDSNLSADLGGLHPPTQASRPTFMPYVTLEMGDTEQRGMEAGLDVQHRLQNGLTVLGTYHPDYSQIEGVVEPVSYSYTERYLSEVRPFFTTGGSGYLPKSQIFYTRRIEEFDLGLKLFGTLGREQLGLLYASDLGKETALAGSWQHYATPDHRTGLFFVSHQEAGEPSNFVGMLDTTLVRRCPEGADSIWAVTYQSAGEGAGGAVYSIGGDHDRGSGKLYYDWMARYVTPNFYPALGYWYDDESLGASFNIGKSYSYVEGALRGRGWSLSSEYYPYVRKSGLLYSHFGGDYSLRWRNGRTLSAGISQGVDYDQESSDLHAYYYWNTRDLYRNGSLGLLRGTRAGGDYTYASLGQGFQVGAHAALRLALEYSRLAPPSPDAYHAYQVVLTGSRDLTPEKSIAARLIARDAGVSLYAVYRQVVRRGMDAYLVVGDPDAEDTGLAKRMVMKLVWAL
jgi:hypothetical protein